MVHMKLEVNTDYFEGPAKVKDGPYGEYHGLTLHVTKWSLQLLQCRQIICEPTNLVPRAIQIIPQSTPVTPETQFKSISLLKQKSYLKALH
jgi:hypothetical protein